MAAFLPIAVLMSLLVTGTTADGYGGQTTASTSTPSSYTPTPATPPSPYTPQAATSPKPAHDYDDNNKLAAVVRVVVEGQVLCQSCAKPGLDEGVLLPEAHVMVTCRDMKEYSFMSQQLSVADSNGHFHAEFTVERADSHVACSVRLVSSSKPKCNMGSEIHLHNEDKHWIDGHGFRNIVYTGRRLAFSSHNCLAPHHH